MRARRSINRTLDALNVERCMIRTYRRTTLLIYNLVVCQFPGTGLIDATPSPVLALVRDLPERIVALFFLFFSISHFPLFPISSLIWLWIPDALVANQSAHRFFHVFL